MDKPTDQTNKSVPDLKSAAIGFSMFGIGILTLIPAVIGLVILGGIAWVGLKFMIALFGIIAS